MVSRLSRRSIPWLPSPTPMASLFNLAGPDLIIILLIVLLLFGAKGGPRLIDSMRQARGSDEPAGRAVRREKFAVFNRVMGIFVALAALLLLGVLLSRH